MKSTSPLEVPALVRCVKAKREGKLAEHEIKTKEQQKTSLCF